MSKVWIDGKLIDANDAVVPYDDRSITLGLGVFETIALHAGEPFALTRHLSRLVASAQIMGIEVPDLAVVRDAVAAVLSVHDDAPAGFVRITLTAGSGASGEPNPSRSRLIVAIRPGAERTRPVDVIVSEWTRNEASPIAGAKSTSYGDNIVALRAAQATGADEALFANTRGELCEGTTSNVFVVIDDELRTPPLASGCLAGITRALLLESGVGVERTIPIATLEQVTEAFLVSTGRTVQPIGAIDIRALPHCPGPHTLEAQRVWAQRIASRIDP